MWEMVESPGNELDLPKRGHRIIGAEGRGRNLGSTRIGGHRKYIQQGDPKELVLEAKLKRVSRRKAGQTISSEQA